MKKFLKLLAKDETGKIVGNIYLLILLIPMLIWGIFMIKAFVEDYLDDIRDWFIGTKNKIKEKYDGWKNRKYTKIEMEGIN